MFNFSRVFLKNSEQLQTDLSEHITRAGEMVGQSIQRFNGILAGCSLGNRHGRVLFCNILESITTNYPCSFPCKLKRARSWMTSRQCLWRTVKIISRVPSAVLPWSHESVTRQPEIYFSDGSGGAHSQDPRLRRAGWNTACLEQDAELNEACHGTVPGRQPVPRAGLTALVVLAENINTNGVYEVRVDAQFVLTSIAKLVRAKRGTNGDLWLQCWKATLYWNDSSPTTSKTAKRTSV